jgi:hypothetical protein
MDEEMEANQAFGERLIAVEVIGDVKGVPERFVVEGAPSVNHSVLVPSGKSPRF